MVKKKENKEIKVSVIVPTYKRPHLIKKAIQNIKNQTYKNLEIIVVNDNGEENLNYKNQTLDELKEFIENKEITYIELEKNQGGAIARNVGIENSTGKYISFYDDDDEYFENKIEAQLLFFEKNRTKNIAFVKCEMQYMFNGLKIGNTQTKHHFEKENLLKEHLLNLHGIVGTTSFLFDAEILKEQKGFENVKIRQEYTLILKLLKNGYTGLYMPDILVTLDLSEEDSITRNKNETKVDTMEFILNERLKNKELLSEKEMKKIQKDHFLDLAEWYCGYKKIDCIKYSFLGYQLGKKNAVKLIKMNIRNILGKNYIKIRKKIKGY